MRIFVLPNLSWHCGPYFSTLNPNDVMNLFSSFRLYENLMINLPRGATISSFNSGYDGPLSPHGSMKKTAVFCQLCQLAQNTSHRIQCESCSDWFHYQYLRKPKDVSVSLSPSENFSYLRDSSLRIICFWQNERIVKKRNQNRIYKIYWIFLRKKSTEQDAKNAICQKRQSSTVPVKSDIAHKAILYEIGRHGLVELDWQFFVDQQILAKKFENALWCFNCNGNVIEFPAPW